MKLIRCQHNDTVFHARLEGEMVYPFRGDPYGEHRETGQAIPLDQVRVLPPTLPTKIIAVGLNYMDHVQEVGLEVPKWPTIFLKANSALTGHRDPVYYPRCYVSRMDYEAEMVVVMGRRARHVSREEALDYVLGYTCGNDVTARNLQPSDGQWCLAKGLDSFAPVGPWIETGLDPSNLEVEMLVNGALKQKTNTRHLIFDVPYLVEYLSNCMTLEPGDLIFTGTSSGIGPVQPGDEMEVRIQGVGSLVNPVEPEPDTD